MRTDLTSGSIDPEVDFGKSREKAADKFGIGEGSVQSATACKLSDSTPSKRSTLFTCSGETVDSLQKRSVGSNQPAALGLMVKNAVE